MSEIEKCSKRKENLEKKEKSLSSRGFGLKYIDKKKDLEDIVVPKKDNFIADIRPGVLLWVPSLDVYHSYGMFWEIYLPKQENNEIIIINNFPVSEYTGLIKMLFKIAILPLLAISHFFRSFYQNKHILPPKQTKSSEITKNRKFSDQGYFSFIKRIFGFAIVAGLIISLFFWSLQHLNKPILNSSVSTSLRLIKNEHYLVDNRNLASNSQRIRGGAMRMSSTQTKRETQRREWTENRVAKETSLKQTIVGGAVTLVAWASFKKITSVKDDAPKVITPQFIKQESLNSGEEHIDLNSAPLTFQQAKEYTDKLNAFQMQEKMGTSKTSKGAMKAITSNLKPNKAIEFMLNEEGVALWQQNTTFHIFQDLQLIAGGKYQTRWNSSSQEETLVEAVTSTTEKRPSKIEEDILEANIQRSKSQQSIEAISPQESIRNSVSERNIEEIAPQETARDSINRKSRKKLAKEKTARESISEKKQNVSRADSLTSNKGKKDFKTQITDSNAAFEREFSSHVMELAKKNPNDLKVLNDLLKKKSNFITFFQTNMADGIIHQAQLKADDMFSEKWVLEFVKNPETLNAINNIVKKKFKIKFNAGTGMTRKNVFDSLFQKRKIILKDILRVLQTNPHVKSWIRLRFPETVTDSEIDFCILYYKFILLKDIWMIWVMQKNLTKVYNNMDEPFRYLLDYTLQQAVEQDNFDIIVEICEILWDFNPLFSYRDAAFQDRLTLDLLCYNQEDVLKMLNDITLNPDDVTDTSILELARQRCSIEHKRDDVVKNINKYLVRSLDSIFETKDGSVFSYRVARIEMDHIFDNKYGYNLKDNMKFYNQDTPNYRYKGNPDKFINDERNLIPATVLFHKDRTQFETYALWSDEQVNAKIKTEAKKYILSHVVQVAEKEEATRLKSRESAIIAIKRFLFALQKGAATPGFFEKQYPEVKKFIMDECYFETKKTSRHAHKTSSEAALLRFLEETKKMLAEAKG